MAGRSRKKSQAPSEKAFDDFDEEIDGFEEDISKLDPDEPGVRPVRSRDWRDVEKLRELRELRKLVGDDLDELIGEFETNPPKSKKPKR